MFDAGIKSFRTNKIKNYRHNLQFATGKLAKGYDAHHTLPKAEEFREFFEQANISGDDVYSVKNLVWRKSEKHSSTAAGQALSKEHTKLWRQFKTDNPFASKEEILKQRDIIEKKVWGNTNGDTPGQ
jgi:hypothetical protein